MNNLSCEFSSLRRLGLAVLLFIATSSAWGQASVTGMNQVSSTRVGRTTYDYTYTINVANGSPGLSNAVATVTSSAAATVIVQGSVSLGTLAAGASTTSTNTFTLQQNRLVAFDPTALSWTITGTPFDVVPNVVGLRQSAASTAITAASLAIGSTSQQSSTTVTSGNVISQSPVAGTQVAAGSAVSVVVSSGPPQVAVPNVVGLGQAAVSGVLTTAGLVLGSVTQQSSTMVMAGNVISETPIATTLVNVGSAVSVVVSSGPLQVAVPNVVGLTQSGASGAFSTAGLLLGSVTQQASTTVTPGNIISETPIAATLVNLGSAVNIIVSSGPPQASVPNVVGLTQSGATGLITGDGLVIGTVTQQTSATVTAGNVISESPIAGTLVGVGSAVNLIVSSGAAAYQGTLLSGNPTSLAVSATTNLGPLQSAAAAIPASTSGGLLLDKIDVYFAPTATVAQVNAAIQSVNGSISAMATGAPAVVIQIPIAPDATTLVQTAQGLAQLPGILDAQPGVMSGDLSLPGPDYAGTENIQHLAAARFPAAFSVLSNPSLGVLNQCPLQSQIAVIVTDNFDSDPNANPPVLSSTVDFANRLPSFVLEVFDDHDGNPTPNIVSVGNPHGNEMTMILAAIWGQGGVAGTGLLGAAPACVTVHGINAQGHSALDNAYAIWFVANRLITLDASGNPAGPSVILNYSRKEAPNWCGFSNNSYDDCADVNSTDIETDKYIGRPAARAETALTWRGLVSKNLGTSGLEYWQRILVVTSAGNEANTPASILYPGAGFATAESFLTLAGTSEDLLALIQDSALWAPTSTRPADATGIGPYPDLTATPEEAIHIGTLESNLGANLSQFGSTIVAGATSTYLPPPGTTLPKLDQWRAAVAPWLDAGDPEKGGGSNALSSADHSLYTMGQNIAASCSPFYSPDANYTGVPCMIHTGTSGSAPQISGLAALLWVVEGALVQPLYQGDQTQLLSAQPASATVNLLTSTARPLAAISTPNTPNTIIDALAALLSLDPAQPVTAASSPVRLYLLDVNQDGAFNAADVQAFVQKYYTDPNRFTAKQISAGDIPDYSVFDLNGDGYTGNWTTTTFDLDPTGSTQRGAPNLTVVSETLPDGHTLHFDETAVSDLDVMCYYAYSGLFDVSTDSSGGIRDTLGCDAVVIMAESGDTLSGGSDGTTLTQTIASIDTKASVNKSGAIAFSAANTNGSSAGARVDVAHAPYPITFGPITNRSYGGASLNDLPAGPQAAFEDRFSGAPPSYFVRRWNADGTAVETDIGTSPSGFFASATSFVDMNDAGVVAFPALDPTFTFEMLMAGNGTFGTTLATFADNASTQLRPQIASTNDVVYEEPTTNIVVTRYAGSGTSRTVASSSAFTALSDRPGISADGNWVAFGGTQTGSSTAGLFVAVATPGAAEPPYTIPAGPTGSPSLVSTGPGGDSSDPNAQFISFGVRPSAGSDATRFGIAAQPTPDGKATQLSIIFVAQRSYFDPLTHVLNNTVYGVYHLTVIATGTGSSTTYSSIQIDPIVEVGDKLSDGIGINRTIADFDLWDPVSKNGTYAGFWVQFLEPSSSGAPIQAVVRRHL